MKKKKRLRKVGIALLVVCGLAAFANSFSDHNKTPANNTPSIASYSLSVDDSAAAPAFADVYASAGQTASSSNFRGSYSGDLKDGKRNGTGSFRWTSNVTYSGGWANDQMDGFGVLQFPEGYTLSGDFEAGKLKNGTIVYKFNGITWQQSVEVATHFVRNKRAMIGLILVLLMIFLAFVAPLFSGYAYDEIVTALNAKGRKKAAVGISPRVPAIHEMVTGEAYDDIYADKTFSFRTNAGVVHAIRGINLNLQKGETVAIVGESGSGKSVTMKAAVGLLDSNATIHSGEILYTYDDGHGQDKTVDLLKLSKKQLRTEYNGQRLAMVFQDPMTSLDPTMTIGKQIMEGMLLHKHMPKDEARTKALQLLELVGITDAEKRFRNYPHQLSGGMRQRVVIAIALSAEPDILICDEPTTALDVTIQSKILDLIKQIQQKMHLSVIYITHDLGVVAKVADYVNVMYAGKIVEVGNVEEIFYEPRHPYTWGLLSAMPDLETADDRLYSIPGSPPNLLHEPVGDAFAARNRFAMVIDKKAEPPLFKVSETHYAATWLLHPDAPAFEMPKELKERLERAKKEAAKYL